MAFFNFNLERGDPDNLLGKVMVYSELKDRSQNIPRYILMDTDGGELKNTKIELSIEDEDIYLESLKDKKIDVKALRLESNIIFLEDLESRVDDVHRDIISIGRHQRSFAMPMLKSMTELYMAFYASQLTEREKIDNIPPVFTENYRDLNTPDLVSRLYQFVGELYRSRDSGNLNDFEQTALGLRAFSLGSDFYPEVEKMIEEVKVVGDNISLIQGRIGIIEAVLNQDYKRAAEIKKEIEIMKGR